MIRIVVLLLIFQLSITAFAQDASKNKFDFALAFKPIFASEFFGTGPLERTIEESNLIQNQKYGYSLGGVIRRNLKKNLAFESGISFTQRNFILDIDNPLPVSDTFRIVGYEIPLNLLVFVQLNEKIFMNVTGGLGIDMFPSDVTTLKKQLSTYSGRYNVFNVSLNANSGVEYRTKESGKFYVGAAFHRPFFNIYRTSVDYTYDPTLAARRFIYDLRGTYLTLDLRYYFHSNPEKSKVIERKYPGKKK